MNDHRYDDEIIYCRRLGHDLTFAYCRQGSRGLPCAAILGCWRERLPVSEILTRQFSPEELEQAFHPPQDKLTSILDIVRQVQTG